MTQAVQVSPEVLKEQLRDQILRAHMVADRCMAQSADGDLKPVLRRKAEKNAVQAIKIARELERSLGLVEDHNGD